MRSPRATSSAAKENGLAAGTDGDNRAVVPAVDRIGGHHQVGLDAAGIRICSESTSGRLDRDRAASIGRTAVTVPLKTSSRPDSPWSPRLLRARPNWMRARESLADRVRIRPKPRRSGQNAVGRDADRERLAVRHALALELGDLRRGSRREEELVGCSPVRWTRPLAVTQRPFVQSSMASQPTPPAPRSTISGSALPSQTRCQYSSRTCAGSGGLESRRTPRPRDGPCAAPPSGRRGLAPFASAMRKPNGAMSNAAPGGTPSRGFLWG